MAAESPRARAEERLGRKLSSDVEALWAFAKAEAPDSPRQALAPLGLRLAGVFDAFAEPDAKVCWNTHMRFRFDVPEVCTFVVSEEEPGKHWCLLSDAPDEEPKLTVYSSGEEGDATFSGSGDNVFAAVTYAGRQAAEEEPEKGDKSSRKRRRTADGAKAQSEEAGKLLLARLQDFARAKGFDPEARSAWAKRRKEATAATLNKLGIVVPVDPKSEVGYRPLPQSAAKTRSMLQRAAKAEAEGRKPDLSALDDVTTLTSIANDECDFGMGLEWGHALYTGCSAVARLAEPVLAVAYMMLGRQPFDDVAAEHLKVRDRPIEEVDELRSGGSSSA